MIEQDKDPSRFKDAAIGSCGMAYVHAHASDLGQRPPIDLPSAKGGNIPDVAYYDRKYGKVGWAFSTIYSVSIGQGEVLVAPLQMANLAAIFANKGWYYDPHVVRAVGHPDSVQQKYLTKHITDVDPKWYDHIQEGMRRVVNEAGGTARQARIQGDHRLRKDRDRRESAWSGPCRFHLLRADGGPQDRHGRVRGELRLRRHLGRTDRQLVDRAIPHRYHHPTRGGEANGGSRPHRQGSDLREESETETQTR